MEKLNNELAPELAFVLDDLLIKFQLNSNAGIEYVAFFYYYL